MKMINIKDKNQNKLLLNVLLKMVILDHQMKKIQLKSVLKLVRLVLILKINVLVVMRQDNWMEMYVIVKNNIMIM